MGQAKLKRKRVHISKGWVSAVIVVICVAGILIFDALQRYNQGANKNSDARTQGSPNARVHIIEFLDFQCPECAKLFAFIHQLIEAHAADIYFEVKYFPLSHSHSLESAVYAECSAEQNKFWEFTGLLMGRQAQWRTLADPIPTYRQMAQEAGLDLSLLETCVQGDEARAFVDADKAYGESKFIQATPTCFINEKMFVGYESVKKELERQFNPGSSSAAQQ